MNEKRKYFVGDMLAKTYSIIRDVLHHVDVLMNPQLRDFYVEILKSIAMAMRVLDFKKNELITVINEVYDVSQDVIENEVDKSYEDARKYAEAIRAVKPPEQRIERLSEVDPVKKLLIDMGVADDLDRPTSAFMALAAAIRAIVRDAPELANNVDLINAYALQAVINIHKTREKISDELLAELYSRVCKQMNVSYDELYSMLKELDDYVKKQLKKEVSLFM